MSGLYDSDFHSWTVEQAAKLRRLADRRVNADLDLEHLAEEIEDLGKRDLRALLSEVALVIEHLLKLEHSPAVAPRAGWQHAVGVHRFAARQILTDSPGLRSQLVARFGEVWAQGRRQAVLGLAQDGVAAAQVPADCPYDLDAHLLAADWLP